MSGNITESIVERAALDWLSGLGYEVLSGIVITPGEPAAERADYKQVFLYDRLQTKLLSGDLRLPSQGFGTAGVPTGAGKLAEKIG
jgi:type I restriction enzyme R subunit